MYQFVDKSKRIAAPTNLEEDVYFANRQKLGVAPLGSKEKCQNAKVQMAVINSQQQL